VIQNTDKIMLGLLEFTSTTAISSYSVILRA